MQVFNPIVLIDLWTNLLFMIVLKIESKYLLE